MKNVKLISLALSMLICFVAKAQEKPAYEEYLQKNALETKTATLPLTKLKDTIKVPINYVQPITSNNQVIICVPSRPLMNEPLYIIDGAIIDSKQFSKINPNDIESIKVLKGIEAKAYYGTRAINGAIIIITKDND